MALTQRLYAFIVTKHQSPKENCNLHYLILPSAGHWQQSQEELTMLQKLLSQDQVPYMYSYNMLHLIALRLI